MTYYPYSNTIYKHIHSIQVFVINILSSENAPKTTTNSNGMTYITCSGCEKEVAKECRRNPLMLLSALNRFMKHIRVNCLSVGRKCYLFNQMNVSRTSIHYHTRSSIKRIV